MSSTETIPPTALGVASPFDAMLWLTQTVRRDAHGLRALTERAPDGDASAQPLIHEAAALLPTDELGGLFGDLVALKALAEGVSTAILAEAVARGVVAAGDDSPRPIGPKITAWVGDQAAAAARRSPPPWRGPTEGCGNSPAGPSWPR